MSDSVVIYSPPVARGDEGFGRHLSTILKVGRFLLTNLLAAGLPSRGAISHGEFYASEDDQVFVGNALVEAYELAEAQEWIGAAVGSSLAADLEAMYKAFTGADVTSRPWLAIADYEYLPFDVPVKREVHPTSPRMPGPTTRLYVLNWPTSSAARDVSKRRFFIEGLMARPNIAIKYQNTMDFIERAGRDGMRGLISR